MASELAKAIAACREYSREDHALVDDPEAEFAIMIDADHLAPVLRILNDGRKYIVECGVSGDDDALRLSCAWDRAIAFLDPSPEKEETADE